MERWLIYDQLSDHSMYKKYLKKLSKVYNSKLQRTMNFTRMADN